MSFKGLRFAGLEWKNITASKVMWVVIAAIAIMPLLYGALYLAAFQDPYARLNTVPVAVVNEDKGAVISTENRNLGDDVVDELKGTTDGLQWHFVSADEAQKGLENGEYFMTCTIPADFSESVASVDGSAPEKAQLKIEYNQSENMLASQIGETVWKEVRTRVSDTVATEYWTTVLSRVADSGKDIQTAADGAGDLEDGLTTAHDGSKTITSNLGTLKDGALTLDTGLGTLASGASALDSGLGTLAGGTFTLKDGTQSLVSGANQLKDGTSQVAGGASDLAANTASDSKLGGGASMLASKLSEASEQTANLPAQTQALSDGVHGLVDSVNAAVGSDDSSGTLLYGASALSTSLPVVSEGLSQAGNAVGLAGDGAGQLSGSLAQMGTAASDASSLETVEELQAALKNLSGQLSVASASAGELQANLAAIGGKVSDAAGSVDGLAGAASQVHDGLGGMKARLGSAEVAELQGGMSALAASAPTLAKGIDDAAAGATGVSDGIKQVNSGANDLASGASQVDDGASSAVSGANQLNDGATQLVSGAQSAKDGAGQLVTGARSAKDGSAQIADGATQLEDGSATLTSGLTDAVDGSGTLATALSDGAKTAAEQTTNISGKSEVMSDPIELVNEYYTTVKNYGTGFAPYFMALGLWVGGLVAGFVFKPLNNRLIMSGGNPAMVAFANYLPVAFFSLIQATLLMVVLQFGLQLQIDNVPAFYAMGYLTALVFAAIMQMLMAAFGFPGKFVAIILLMLQLTACAGTFPIQTTPDFFQAINPFMPMTYVVQGMRQIMTGLDYGIVGFDCFVLFAIGAVCFALTCLVAWRRRTVRMEDLHPVLQLG